MNHIDLSELFSYQGKFHLEGRLPFYLKVAQVCFCSIRILFGTENLPDITKQTEESF